MKCRVNTHSPSTMREGWRDGANQGGMEGWRGWSKPGGEGGMEGYRDVGSGENECGGRNKGHKGDRGLEVRMDKERNGGGVVWDGEVEVESEGCRRRRRRGDQLGMRGMEKQQNVLNH